MYVKLAHERNYSTIKRKESDIQYIVVHYTGNDGDSARGNLTYFHENVVKSSAHFFVDDNEVCCSVPWYFRAWHCGGNKYVLSDGGSLYGKCTNSNSIGIELCSRKKDGKYYFTDSVLNRAAAFVAQQMKTYNLQIENVVRHYDVTGKGCPQPFVDEKAWAAFKKKVLEYYEGKEGAAMVYYENLDSIPAGEQRELIRELVKRGIIKGNSQGLHLSSDMVRMFVFLRRMNII